MEYSMHLLYVFILKENRKVDNVTVDSTNNYRVYMEWITERGNRGQWKFCFHESR
jgi:hypothetical protein